MRMSRLFCLLWGLTAAFVLASTPWLPEQLGEPDKPMGRLGYLVSTLLALASAGLCSKAFVCWLGHAAPGQVSLPHRDYWMAAPRRAATLDRLGEHVSGIGVLMALLLAGVHLQVLLAAHPAWPQVPPPLWWLGGGLLAAGLLWACWRVRAAFPAPPVTEAAPLRRPRRPGEGH